jgi:hypothetical protein
MDEMAVPLDSESASPLKLKDFIPAVFDAAVEFVAQNFVPAKESHVNELRKNIEMNYLKIPERDILGILESKHDPKELVKEAFELIDDNGLNIQLFIKAGDLGKKKLKAFTDLAAIRLIQIIISAVFSVNENIPSNYSPLILDVRNIYTILQKKKITGEKTLRDEEIKELAQSLIASLIDVEGLIKKLENKLTTGQYL